MEEIAIEKCGFYLPEESRYDYLLNLSEEEDIAKKIKEAIEGIEKYSPELVGILPKDSYHNLSKEDNNKILNRLLRNFNDIPTDIENHIFGEIYEYFLGNFALKEGQGGGEFFTPRTVVQYMVEVLKPREGKILDPACGFRVIIVIEANSYVNIGSSRLLPKFKTQKINSWCAV